VEEIKSLRNKVNESKLESLGLMEKLEEKSEALKEVEKKVINEKKLRTDLEESHKLLKEEYEQFKTQHTMPRTETPIKKEEVFVENSSVEVKEPVNERLQLMLSKM
jgi:predicted nuclease with TOPRIM domain